MNHVAGYFREYGPASGAPVVVLHGGPGAIGSAGSLARLLADPAHVFEHWQRATTVADHIVDLLAFVTDRCDRPPVLVGHSWGAMLALAFAAAQPKAGAALCLVGCGTFDPEARAVFKARSERGDLVDPFPDDPLDNVDGAALDPASWSDMLRLQADGTYPAAFARIEMPVLMLHGADDPHPGDMIRASLAPYLPQLAYREWARCGHYPWRERGVRDDFARVVRAWLARV